MSRTMRMYLQKNFFLYVFVSVLFVMGVVFGALLVNSLTIEQRQEMTSFLGSFFHLIEQGDPVSGAWTFQHLFMMNVKWVFLIWIFGISVAGLPLILLLDFFKGVLVGFSIGYLTGELSWHGMVFAMAAIVPQNLFLIPVLLILSVFSISFSLYVIRYRLFQKKGELYPQFVSFSLATLFMAFAMAGISWFEAAVTPVMMHWATPLIAGASLH